MQSRKGGYEQEGRKKGRQEKKRDVESFSLQNLSLPYLCISSVNLCGSVPLA